MESRFVVDAVKNYVKERPTLTVAGAHAEYEPSAVLVVEDDRTWTRQEVFEQAESLAEALYDHGVRHGDRVLIGVGPSSTFLIAALATWALGASIVPINLDDPAPRLHGILEDTCASSLVAASDASRTVFGEMKPFNERIGFQMLAASALATRNRSRGDGSTISDEAYVIFTSGSTGRPKGVSVSHGALASYLREAERLYVRGRSHVSFPFQLPVTFDAAITSWALPLFVGGVCHVLTKGQPSWMLADFLRFAKGQCIVKTTPSQLRVLAHLLAKDDLSHLRCDIVVGGEPLIFEDCAWASEAAGVMFHNEYGPTEATVGCIVKSFSSSELGTGPVPIGYPHDSAVVRLRPRPEDRELFELTLAGPCLATGYLGPSMGGFHVALGERRYATGDLVRVASDGALMFCGRVDDQVKVAGHRVELGEVETAVRESAVGARVVSFEADGALWLFLVTSATVDTTSLMEDVRRRLPRYMWPRQILAVPEIPMTPHGKADKEALLRMLPSHSRPSASGEQHP